jgi:hypothetical protein
MASDRTRNRDDGTKIDPVKDLAEYVQSLPATGESAPPPPPRIEAKPEEKPLAAEAAPLAPPVQLAPPPPPPEPTVDERLAQTQRERDEARAEVERTRREREIEATTRRVIAEQQTRPAQPAPPLERTLAEIDAEIDDTWFTDQARARQLIDEKNQRAIAKQIGESREQDVRQQRKAQGDSAYRQSRAALMQAGVPQADLDNPNRLTAVYTVITRPPTAAAPNPYYDRGGPLSAEVIRDAWRDLFGLPQAQGGAPAPAYVPPTPPGSSRPAPAASGATQRAIPVSGDQKRDIDHLADTFGYDREKLIARRRARLAKEKE